MGTTRRFGAFLVAGSLVTLAGCHGDVAPPSEPRSTTSPATTDKPARVASAPAPEHTQAERTPFEVTPHTLDQFLDVRARLFGVYRDKGVPDTLLQWTLNGEGLDPEALGDARLRSVLDRFNRERHLGMARAGLREDDYSRIESIVYGQWWKATAGGGDIAKGIAFQQELKGLIEAKLQRAGLEAAERRSLQVRHATAERRIAELQWTQSAAAARILNQLPASTKLACESRTDEITRYAMLPLRPYNELFSVNGLRPLSTIVHGARQ